MKCVPARPAHPFPGAECLNSPLEDLFRSAAKTKIDIIARVAFDSGSLSGGWTPETYTGWEPGSPRPSTGAHLYDKSQALWGVFGLGPRQTEISRSPELLAHLAAWLARSVEELSQSTAGLGAQAGE